MLFNLNDSENQQRDKIELTIRLCMRGIDNIQGSSYGRLENLIKLPLSFDHHTSWPFNLHVRLNVHRPMQILVYVT